MESRKRPLSGGSSVLFLVFLLLCSCDDSGRSARPSSGEYIKEYLPELKDNEIEKLDYTFYQAVGGYVSLARIEVADVGSVSFAWQTPEDRVLKFDGDMRDVAMQFIQTKFIMAAGKTKEDLPNWVDLDYTSPLHIHKDVAVKHRHRTFFLRKDETVFYLIVSGG